jgi:hypothetical protein
MPALYLTFRPNAASALELRAAMAAPGVRVWRAAVRTGDGAWDPSEQELDEFVAHVRTFNSVRPTVCARLCTS